MDLRDRLNPSQIDRACSVLDYQPFIITDELQTGAAYSWMYNTAAARSQPRLLLDRRRCTSEEWDRFTDANARCRRMYDTFVTEIARRYPGGTLLDLACNNGYFPVNAELCGMRRGTGVDIGLQYEDSIAFLNEVLGTNAEFRQAAYDSRMHTAPIDGRYTVVVASVILCHLPDPLNFLAFLGTLATDAIFHFGQVIDTDALIVAYLPPQPALGRDDMPFPLRFNSDVRISRGLLYYGLEEMGFKNIHELPWSDDWLPPYINPNQREPRLEDRLPGCNFPNDVERAWKLQVELRQGSTHTAILATR
jgi:hypothetical protein